MATPPAPPATKSKPVVPAGPDDAEGELDTVDEADLQAAVEVTDSLEADDPDAAAAVRKLCMAVATELGLSDSIPEAWNTDGSVGDPAPSAGD